MTDEPERITRLVNEAVTDALRDYDVTEELWRHDPEFHQANRATSDAIWDIATHQRDEAWNEAIEAAVKKVQYLENIIGGLLSRLDDALAPSYGGAGMHTGGQTPDWFIEAAKASCYSVTSLRNLKKPTGDKT